jgi:hypothetical protein
MAKTAKKTRADTDRFAPERRHRRVRSCNIARHLFRLRRLSASAAVFPTTMDLYSDFIPMTDNKNWTLDVVCKRSETTREHINQAETNMLD